MAAIGAVLLRVAAPIRGVRIGRIRSERLGHLALEPELYLAGREAAPASTTDLFYFPRPTCNDQLKRMWQRVLPTPPLLEHVDRVSRALPGAERHIVPWIAEDHEGTFYRRPARLHFTEDEHA